MGSVSRAARTRSLSRDIPPSRSWLSGSAWIRRFSGAASGPWKPTDGGGHLRPAAGVGPGPEGDQGPRSDRGGPRAPEADALARSAGDPGCGADREPGNPEGGGKKEVSRGPIQGHLPELVPAIRLWLQDQGVWERTPDVREAQRGTVGWSSGS